MKTIVTFRAAMASAALLLLPFAASAQTYPEMQSGRSLSDALNTLATDPHNVRALISAGESALALDDPNGALGFFARAEEINPRNPQVKAGLARAMLMTEKPREALKLFGVATDLGMAEGEIAGDRGLAYDLRGDPKRAQRDYMLALRRAPDPEVTRRLALSLAISGEREQANQTLDPLLRRQDRAAWRARAFILAMNGDIDGANGVARSVMPATVARPMAPFFARLSSLSDSQKAAAVHFGRIPAEGRGRGRNYTEADDSRGPVAAAPVIAQAAQTDEEGPDEPVAAPAQVARDTRRSADREPVTLAARTSQPAPVGRGSPAPVRPSPAPVITAPTPAPTPAPGRSAAPTRLRSAAPGVPYGPRDDAPVPGFVEPFKSASPPPAPTPPSAAAVASNPAETVGGKGDSAPAAAPASPSPVISPPPAQTVATPLERSLASIVQGLELEQAEAVALPDLTARKAASKPSAAEKAAEDKKAADKKAADKKAADKKAAAAKPDPKKQHPERIWAQIATGGNKAALATDYGKFVKKSPAAFKGMSGWSVPFGRTRRLLVGPFPSSAKASDFLKKAGITGFAWTSPAGTEIEKLGAK